MLDEGKLITQAGDLVHIDGQALSLSVIGIIAKRMGMVDEGTSYAEVRAWLGSDSAEVQELLATAAALMKEHAGDAASALGEDSSQWARKYYEAAGVLPSGVGEIALAAGIDAMADKLDRICSTSVAGLIAQDGSFVPFEQGYKDAVDAVIRAFATGANVQDEIKRQAQRLARTGLAVQYADGRRVNIASAVRTTAKTEIGKAVQDMRDAMGREFGADGVEVSAHSLCAPDHLPYQGKQFSYEKFDDIQDGLQRKIATGPNCTHTTRPVILGVSSETYTDGQREHMRRESEKKVVYRDARGVKRETTGYGATQVQRAHENAVRKLGIEREALRKAGQDVEELDAAIADARKEYERLCRSLGLRPQRQRLDIYELSTKGGGKARKKG